MPTYCYKCLSCQNGFDVVKSISEYKNLESCPVCGGLTERDHVTEYHGSKTQKQLLEHYDLGLGIVVKDRSHWMKYLDKNGITPYRKNESLMDGK